MTERTAEIIMICKGRHEFGDGLSCREAIAAYLSDQCSCDIKPYYKEVDEVIWLAALDYMDTSGKPSVFMRQAKDAYDLHNNPLSKIERINWYEAVCIAFKMTQVKNRDGEYINGFTEENTKCVCKTN